MPVITEVSQILRMPRAEAERHYPVQLEAVVTYSDPSWGLLFVQDGTAGIFMDRTNPHIEVKPGSLLAIQGVTGCGLFSPFIYLPKARLLGQRPLPAPLPVSITRLNTGEADCQWVELSGVVQVENDFDGRLLLDLSSGANRFRAWVMESDGYRDLKLTDTQIRLKGVAGGQFDPHKQIHGFQVYVSSLSDITVLERPPVDAFSKPVSLSRDLTAYAPLGAWEHRVHVQGVVTFDRPGRELFLRDASGGFCLETTQDSTFHAGEWVDAAGFRMPGAVAPRLVGATVHSTGRSEPVLPVSISATQTLTGKLNFQLVQTEARLLGVHTNLHNETCLSVEVGGQPWTAVLEGTNAAVCLRPLAAASLLQVTGIYESRDVPGAVQPAVTLWLRSLKDVEVLGAPMAQAEFWAVWAIATAGLVLVCGAATVFWMRYHTGRRVKQAYQESQRLLRHHLEERERISQDLHDNIMQSIYAVGLGLDDCRRLLQESPREASERLGIAIGALNSVIGDVRQFIGGLEPKVLNGSELKTALKSLALTAGESNSHVVIQVDPNAAHHLTSQQATHLLNIAKEAMSNSLRHANAAQTVVALQLAKDHVRMEIVDDGAGFNSQPLPQTGNGLRNVSARARELGAQLEIISAPGEGTRVVIELPPFSHHDSRRPAA